MGSLNIKGDALRQIRRARHLTQTQLGTMASINGVEICRWESNAHGISIDNARKLAIALNCTISDITDGSKRRRKHHVKRRAGKEDAR